MNHKGIIIQIATLILVVAMMAVSPVLAAKPDGSNGTTDVIAKSNGFPSGEHYNLNVHGKSVDYAGDPTPGGNSVFILEYNTEEYPKSFIQYVSNKKSSLETLTVLDPLAEPFDDDPALVQLPYEADGYYVFARILGKPNNGNTQSESNIILYPNDVVAACNDTDPVNPDFPEYTECPDDPLLALGLIVGPNLYDATPEEYVRFDSTVTKGKGQSKATDITRLFLYVGWVVSDVLDTNADGVIDLNDVPVDDYDGDGLDPNRDYNNDGYEDEGDVEAWLTDQAALGNAWYFDENNPQWIFNIADLVITEQGLVNDGTKLVQIRFYPVDTTQFEPDEGDYPGGVIPYTN